MKSSPRGNLLATLDSAPVSSRRESCVVAVLLALQAILLAYGATVNSPTLDEPQHLAAGISHWRFARFDLYKVNPPLVQMLAALPVLAVGPKTDWSHYYEGTGTRAEWKVGDDFVMANGPRIVWLVTLARWGLVPLVLVGGWTCWRWARDLYGEAAGLAALALWCSCPNILAYGQIITADAAATVLGVAANYLFWKWLREPSWPGAFTAGGVLGLAELTKTTWVVLFALWPFIAFAWWWGDWKRCQWIRQMSAVLLSGVLVVNLGYGFEGTGTRLGDFTFVTRLFAGTRPDGLVHGNRFSKCWLAALPMPLPKNYLEGIDLQRRDFENRMPSYLRGAWRNGGWWYWYVYALAVKVPLGTWGLGALAAAQTVSLRRRSAEAVRRPAARPTWRDELVLLSPMMVVLALVSSQTGFSRYIRYVLPILPYVFIGSSGVFRSARLRWLSPPCGAVRELDEGLPQPSHPDRAPKLAADAATLKPARHCRWKAVVHVLGLAALGWSVLGGLWVYPNSMSYFNELAGGPLGGPAHLIDAQVEWGQDLLFLRKWLARHPEAQPLNLVYFGPFNPRLARIEFKLPPKGIVQSADLAEIAEVPPGLKPGWYAISVNFLYGYPYLVRDEQGGREWVTRAYYSYFRRFQPAAMAGYGIYIYNLQSDEIERSRSSLGRKPGHPR